MAQQWSSQANGAAHPPVAYPPVVQFAFVQDHAKGEDVAVVRPTNRWPGRRHSPRSSVTGDEAVQEPGSPQTPSAAMYGLYCIFDGHNGPLCAQWAEVHLAETLQPLLPAGGPPPEFERVAYKAWREELMAALTLAITALHRSFADAGLGGGCDATLILQADWLLTVLNLGNSRAVLDTGRDVIQLTVEDRATRGIGDFDLAEEDDVPISLPLVTQVKVPTSGGRIILASSGAWSAFHSARGQQITRSTVRSWPTEACPQRLLHRITKFRRAREDTSIIVLDLLPPNKQTFAEVAGVAPAGKRTMFNSGKTRREQKVVPVEVLTRVDLAVVAGVIPSDRRLGPPAWYSPHLNDTILAQMKEAQDAWARANGELKMEHEAEGAEQEEASAPLRIADLIPDEEQARLQEGALGGWEEETEAAEAATVASRSLDSAAAAVQMREVAAVAAAAAAVAAAARVTFDAQPAMRSHPVAFEDDDSEWGGRLPRGSRASVAASSMDDAALAYRPRSIQTGRSSRRATFTEPDRMPLTSSDMATAILRHHGRDQLQQLAIRAGYIDTRTPLAPEEQLAAKWGEPTPPGSPRRGRPGTARPSTEFATAFLRSHSTARASDVAAVAYLRSLASDASAELEAQRSGDISGQLASHRSGGSGAGGGELPPQPRRSYRAASAAASDMGSLAEYRQSAARSSFGGFHSSSGGMRRSSAQASGDFAAMMLRSTSRASIGPDAETVAALRQAATQAARPSLTAASLAGWQQEDEDNEFRGPSWESGNSFNTATSIGGTRPGTARASGNFALSYLRTHSSKRLAPDQPPHEDAVTPTLQAAPTRNSFRRGRPAGEEGGVNGVAVSPSTRAPRIAHQPSIPEGEKVQMQHWDSAASSQLSALTSQKSGPLTPPQSSPRGAAAGPADMAWRWESLNSVNMLEFMPDPAEPLRVWKVPSKKLSQEIVIE